MANGIGADEPLRRRTPRAGGDAERAQAHGADFSRNAAGSPRRRRGNSSLAIYRRFLRTIVLRLNRCIACTAALRVWTRAALGVEASAIKGPRRGAVGEVRPP